MVHIKVKVVAKFTQWCCVRRYSVKYCIDKQ